MSTLAVQSTSKAVSQQKTSSDWRGLARLGAIGTVLQLLCMLTFTIIGTAVGPEPATAEEYFAVLNDNRLVGLLRLDFATLILIALFVITSLGIYAALRQTFPGYALLGTTAVLVGTILGLANHSALSMITLSDQYALATTASEQARLLAAGDALIAGDMWHSTAGFLAGVFMQGGFVFLSWLMWRLDTFHKATAVTGVLANGLDWLHLFIGLVAPALGFTVLAIGGVFYLFWFPLLAWDLWRWSQNQG